MAKLQVEKRNGLFDLKPLYEWMRNALDGIYRIEVKKVRKPRSLDQNGWLFGCIYPILLDALLEAGWEFVSVEQVHEFFKAQMTAGKSSVSCPLKPSDSAPLKHSTMPP